MKSAKELAVEIAKHLGMYDTTEPMSARVVFDITVILKDQVVLQNEAMRGKFPLVLYYEDEEGRNEMVRICQESNPNLIDE